jgi:hypothetical protein
MMKKIIFLLLMVALSLPCLSGIGWGESGLNPTPAETQTPKTVDIGGEGAEAHKPQGTRRRRPGAASPRPRGFLGRSSPLGPHYKPHAPIRTSVGKGYVLRGLVQDEQGLVPGARLEFWLAGPDGRYDDAHRATVISDKDGAYQFESNFPPKTAEGPPQINLFVTASGHSNLIKKHYPKAGQTQETMDLFLKPRPVPPRNIRPTKKPSSY